MEHLLRLWRTVVGDPLDDTAVERYLYALRRHVDADPGLHVWVIEYRIDYLEDAGEGPYYAAVAASMKDALTMLQEQVKVAAPRILGDGDESIEVQVLADTDPKAAADLLGEYSEHEFAYRIDRHTVFTGE